MMFAGDSCKLVEESNYHVWRLSMRSMFKQFDLWKLVKLKNTTHAAITMSVSDDLEYLVSENDDTADVWQVLERNFQWGDQGQILLLSQQLHSLKMMEGALITQYIQKAKELKNKLLSMKEAISNKTMASIVVNGVTHLKRSYSRNKEALDLMKLEKGDIVIEAGGEQYKLRDVGMLTICTACQTGKQSRERFFTSSPNKASEQLQLIHTDPVVSLLCPSLSRSRYFEAFIDYYLEMRIFESLAHVHIPKKERRKMDS
ncbi:hypothetical protein Mp_6g12230 [Marchantia polymorpha subsp. ruderalis]|uniref:DUF4219 domain-containing protein n=2 Tax=Marchantia polymorpha TaxID=3197 RepID=A0AAF6BR63_MARPO|nr:hypothetical protein MARPO_0135s0013 [Marchantia polymorpha]BBN14497.1 hypothetical protein Mp_6g12230 [Marchantia polymorpha subsp. ruderalis]|eukprot:PTQ29727.1 hypothetical protein MARPO_0135s0013 [Marchantia polymorpha]